MAKALPEKEASLKDAGLESSQECSVWVSSPVAKVSVTNGSSSLGGTRLMSQDAANMQAEQNMNCTTGSNEAKQG